MMVEPAETLSAAHRGALFRYIRSIVRDPAIAEDLTQETLLRAHRKLVDLEDPSKLSAWLYRIATNLCRDRFRRTTSRGRTESLDQIEESSADRAALADSAPRLDKVIEQSEMSACVQEYLANLADPYRAVILLHDVEGLTNPEIALMLGVSLPTVKIRIHRAREKLRDALALGCSFSADERGVTICERKPPCTKD
jgi:RNA polymerase sigma-70 factor (ECF subfamily)